MSNKSNRRYRLSHADLIEHIRTLIGHLTEYLSRFTDFDSTINADTITRLNNLLTQALSMLSDNVIADRQAQLTNIVNGILKECQEHYTKISYFIKKAFPDNAAIRNEFGLNDYNALRTSQGKMIIFMKELHTIAVNYQSELLAAGAQQDYIDKIATLQSELDTANYNQGLYKGKRPILTDERISVFNDMWDEAAAISHAARIIFQNETAKMKLFLLPNRSKSHKDDTQNIEAKTIIATIEEGILDGMFLKLENTGNVNLYFYVANEPTPTLPDFAKNINALKSEIVKTSDISEGNFGKLFVVNENENPGSFKISMME